MADKVTITFDSFNDFQRFIMNPPDQRLKQIARGEVQYAEGTTTATPPRAKPVEKRVAKPVPALQRVTPQEHVLHTLQRWVEEKKKPMPVKKARSSGVPSSRISRDRTCSSRCSLACSPIRREEANPTCPARHVHHRVQ